MAAARFMQSLNNNARCSKDAVKITGGSNVASVEWSQKCRDRNIELKSVSLSDALVKSKN